MSEQQWLEIFSNRLIEMMHDAGYSQEEFARETGLSQATISKYINRQQLPGIKAIINISYVLDSDISELVDFGNTIE